MMYAHQTYVPAPTQQSAPILSVDRTNTTANSLEQTVPQLHEAHTAKDILLGAYKTAHHQVASALLLAFSVDSRLVSIHPPEWLSRVPQHLTITHPAGCACDHCHTHGACGLWRRGVAWPQAVSGPSMLQPRVPTSAGLPSASTAQQRAAPALHPDWQQGSLQQQHSGQQQMYAALRTAPSAGSAHWSTPCR